MSWGGGVLDILCDAVFEAAFAGKCTALYACQHGEAAVTRSGVPALPAGSSAADMLLLHMKQTGGGFSSWYHAVAASFAWLRVHGCVDTANASWVCVCVCLAALSGAGRRVGENMEQVWAQARPVMKLTRYMTKEGYVTGLDDIFLQIADDKMLEFVQSLVSADKACRKKLGRCGGTHLQCHGCASCNMLLWPPDRCPSFEKEDAVVLELLRFFLAWLKCY